MWKFFNSSGAEITAEASQGGLVTALPSGPTDGDEITLVDSVTAPTYSWRLRYVSGKSSNKWVFIGGAAAQASVTAAEGTTSTSFTNLTTTGPSFTVPVAGDYDVEIGAKMYNSGLGNEYMSVAVGSTTASEEWGCMQGRLGEGGTPYTQYRHTGLSASDQIVAKYRTTANTGNFAYRVLIVRPVALGG